MHTGWLIGVLIEASVGSDPSRHFYAVGHADRAQAEWTAVDRALAIGAVACSPWHGMEPVEAICSLSSYAAKLLGLKSGETKALGTKWPRRVAGLVGVDGGGDPG